MAAAQSSSGGTILLTEASSSAAASSSPTSTVPPLTLKLRKAKARLEKKVSWTEDTVDNEGMGKKKSKCCCIYQKPKSEFDETDESETSDNECEHCSGHVEQGSKHKQPSSPPPMSCSSDTGTGPELEQGAAAGPGS